MPKVWAEILGETLYFFKGSIGISAKIGSFCRMTQFLLKLGAISSEIRGHFCRNSLVWQKELLLAETPSFGSFSILAEMFLFQVQSSGFRQKEEIYLSLDH